MWIFKFILTILKWIILTPLILIMIPLCMMLGFLGIIVFIVTMIFDKELL